MSEVRTHLSSYAPALSAQSGKSVSTVQPYIEILGFQNYKNGLKIKEFLLFTPMSGRDQILKMSDPILIFLLLGVSGVRE